MVPKGGSGSLDSIGFISDEYTRVERFILKYSKNAKAEKRATFPKSHGARGDDDSMDTTSSKEVT